MRRNLCSELDVNSVVRRCEVPDDVLNYLHQAGRFETQTWMVADHVDQGSCRDFSGANFVDGNEQREFFCEIVLLESLI